MELYINSQKITNYLVNLSLYSCSLYISSSRIWLLVLLIFQALLLDVVRLEPVTGNVPTLSDSRWRSSLLSIDSNDLNNNNNINTINVKHKLANIKSNFGDQPSHLIATSTFTSILSPHSITNELNLINGGQNGARSRQRRRKRGAPREDANIGLKDHQLVKLHPEKHIYTNQFVLEANGTLEHVQQLAREHGFQYLAHIFDNYHHLEHRKIVKRSVDTFHAQHRTQIEDHPSVISLQQQKLKRRIKRDYIEPAITQMRVNPQHLPFYSSSHHRQYQKDNPPLLPFSKNIIINQSLFHFDHRAEFDDPQWPRMWYLNRGQGLDMNVEDAWSKNVTGKGIVVTILDDGLEKDHPDLYTNYDAMASYDVNGLDDDPMPRYDIIDSNRHGTRCAGEVAANANNSVCAVGIAYNAKVGGIRMLDGDVTDAVEARSLSFNPQHVDIYSASWGPDDDGRTVDGPGDLAAQAFRSGILNGRNGKGSIFVWASGNGGREKDNCNCDGYTNSIWTLSISSATEKGSVPWYSEACPSTLATTYSSGSFGERQIVTTDLHHGCTASHTGTSASAPLAAGICALALEANPKLTWRDMQHIVVMTAKQKNLAARGEWRRNGVGRNVSHWFGYGLLDASAMVDLARDWVTVPNQTFCEFRANNDKDNGTSSKSKSHSAINYYIAPGKNVTVKLSVNCSTLNFLEHVQSKVNLTTQKRGDIEIHLTSPHNTTSILLAVRPMDNSRQGFFNWPFMTVHTWGENPNGSWKLTIFNHGRTNSTHLTGWSLQMHGTLENPDRQKLKSVTTESIFSEFNQHSVQKSQPVNNNNIDDTSTLSPVTNTKNSNTERNKIYVSSFVNNRNLSSPTSSSASFPSSNGKVFHAGLPNVNQDLDDNNKDYDDDDTPPGSASNQNLAAGRDPHHTYVGPQHKHYQHSVDHHSNQYKLYSPHQQQQHHRYPQMTSSSCGLSPRSCLPYFLSIYPILSVVCAFAAIVL